MAKNSTPYTLHVSLGILDIGYSNCAHQRIPVPFPACANFIRLLSKIALRDKDFNYLLVMEISTIRARSTAERGHRRSRIAFVTVGASASFKSLIDEVISEPFLAKLRALHFSQLIVQCGPDYDYFESARPKLGANDPEGLDVSGFAYTKDLKQFFALAAADPEAEMRSRGLIITHAGTSGRPPANPPQSIPTPSSIFDLLTPSLIYDRLRKYPRGAELRLNHHRGAQSDAHGQPPGRDC